MVHIQVSGWKKWEHGCVAFHHHRATSGHTHVLPRLLCHQRIITGEENMEPFSIDNGRALNEDIE